MMQRGIRDKFMNIDILMKYAHLAFSPTHVLYKIRVGNDRDV